MGKKFPSEYAENTSPAGTDKALVDQGGVMKYLTLTRIRTWLGFVDGPASSTANNIATYNDATGKVVKDSGVKIDDAGTTVSTLWTAFKTIAQLATKLNRTGQLRLGNGAWKVSYTNASGDEVELPLGATDTYLKSNGTAVAPSFGTPPLPPDASDTVKGITEYATNTEALAMSSNALATTPANLGAIAPVRKIYADVVPTGTAIGGTLQTLYTQTILANTFTADSVMVCTCSLRYGNASSGTGTLNFKFGGVTIYTTGFGLTGGANTPAEIELRFAFDATTGKCNLTARQFGASTVSTSLTFDLTTASLTSDQTFTIDAIRTGGGGEFSYFTSSMIKI